MHYWQEETGKIFAELGTGEEGLAGAEAALRLGRSGPNTLPAGKVPGVFYVFFSQFLSPLIYILMFAAMLVFYMGEVTDAVIIFLVLIFNAAVGTAQEGRAQNTLLALKKFVQGSATVLREGKIIIIPDVEVVAGDIVLLQEGEKVPADARLCDTHSLRIDESMLTGESLPLQKKTEPIGEDDLPVQDMRNMVFKGTSVVGGFGKAVVTATGLDTEIGKISQKVASLSEDLPLKKNVDLLSGVIIKAVLAISLIILALGLFRGESLNHMFATVVSLAVSVIPEGLPIVITLVLATGVWRMSKKNVLVKKLQAVEGLGQANIIAVDKTGTLTKNEMMLSKVYIGGHMYDVTGSGYEPEGDIMLNGESIDPLNHDDLLLAGRIAFFCSNANTMYVEETKQWKISGDPTEAALGVFAKKIGFKDFEKETEKIFELPFDYTNKYHLTIHEFEDKNFLTLVGAPEKVLHLSEFSMTDGVASPLSADAKKRLESVFERLSAQGYRVLAFAANFSAGKSAGIENLPPLTFLGFFAIRDPLRQEAKEAVSQARKAGIRVIMITGDHKITAITIAREAGIADGPDEVITGAELDSLSQSELEERFAKVNVFVRVTPEQKLKIIEIFKRRGEVVAMTGDGVNDAPSLAAADLGVSMGKIGTEVAKEASDLVLLDDNFGNIISAVEEGRSIYKTIKKVILYLFSTSIGEVLTIAGSIALGLPLPVLPAQIIWLNFVTDGFLDVSLAMEPKEEGLLDGNFKKPHKYILDKLSVWRMVFMGIIIAAGTILVFSQYLDQGMAKALTVSMTTLAVFQWFNAWNCKNEKVSVFMLNPLKNLYLIGATMLIISLQIFAVYNPFMQRYLHTVPLELADWFYIVAVASSILFLEEFRKLIRRFAK
ncbi:MAG: Cation-transporting P-type ATPase, HAD superfamily, subfamily IC [Parcubacteria group bacterium GW2011_GWA2_47_12]|uniref:P-type Cu(+) transporter n=1 Tax=Candidatus Giovannonibacteria bacterium RIFCSPLOWO2_01_FULL_44_16 TaxID=1798348 RepID=A0A1F5X257_9BACT|nr:MAG: Cation-transporting P-type ATPase, HAD superfamily, subfamily IC [Parcubacteria group bacterium GW2011_GWA2_47_12]OGF81988.1 MAG: hypothetical protein A2924_04245 [Candidatus Giovannonibacteria bacterium RIFCSPLOWO2_01_FULL_44_16]